MTSFMEVMTSRLSDIREPMHRPMRWAHAVTW